VIIVNRIGLTRLRAAAIVAAPLALWAAASVPNAAAAQSSAAQSSADAATDGAAAEPVLQLSPATVEPAALTPGSTSDWPIGVTTRSVTLETLLLAVRAEGPLASLPVAAGADPLVTLEVRSCPVPWTAGACAVGERIVIPSTSLAELSVSGFSLADPDGTVPAGVQLLVSASLSTEADDDAQGRSAAVTVRVDASGEPDAAGPAHDGGPAGRGAIADTGLRIGGYAALGLFAVLTGLLLPRLVAQTPKRSGPPKQSGRRA
jgi:hypothetical protein